MTDILTLLALKHGDYRAHGYHVERYTGGGGGWLLYGPDDPVREHNLMIANYGGLSPTKAAAMLEAYRRIDQDARIVAEAAS